MAGFRVYVVSLPEDTVRREEMRARFGEAYDTFELVEGIRLTDRDMLSIRYDQEDYDPALTPAELGCAMAHLVALERFVQSGASHALILEDDVIGDAADISFIMGAVARLPSDAFLLCGGQDGLRGEKFNYGKPDEQAGVYLVPRFVRQFYTRACCYCVTVPSALRLISLQRRRLSLSDNWGLYFRDWPHFYFTRRIAHPLDLQGSRIEASRAVMIPKNELARIRRDGLVIVWGRFLSKCVLRMFAPLLGLVRAK